MDYSGSQTIEEYQGSVLPEYVPYLSLVFKLIVTTVILLLSGWVVYTIKTTRSLHKPHNIFVANLLVSGMMAALVMSVLACIMMVGFQLGVESFITCVKFKWTIFPLHINNMSFVIIAADKAMAIRNPFKHKRMMTSRIIAAVIIGVWLLAVIPTTITIILDVDGYEEIPEYGTCVATGPAYLESIWIFIIPIIISPILTIVLNIYLSIKAYKVHKLIEKETRLSGQSENITALRKKQRNIRQNRKPIITLLVVVLGGVFINILFTAFYMIGRPLIDSNMYQDFMEYVVIHNMILFVLSLQPLVYGLYFKQVRQPMMRCLKKFNKVNSVAPQL